MDFSNCHIGIIKNFEQLQNLAATEIQNPVQPEIRESARKLHSFFRDVVLEHHAEEEQELFNVVTNCARSGEDAEQARILIKQLVAEHRQLEAQWKAIAPDIKRLAKGKFAALDQAAAMQLAQAYLAHARFEEAEFLPFSARVLGERGLSSLGLSLHMRHADVSIPNYI